MNRVLLFTTSVTAIAAGFIAGGAVGWRLAERHSFRVLESTSAVLAASSAAQQLRLLESIDSSQVSMARTTIYHAMRASLAVLNECQASSTCRSDMPQLAPNLLAQISRAQSYQRP